MNTNSLSILFIGVGELGQHHLQSILNSKLHNRISNYTLVDPSTKYIPNNLKNSIHHHSIEEVPGRHFDIILINTKSNIRYDILKYVLKNYSYSHIFLEKLLFGQKDNYLDDEVYHAKNVKMWTSTRLQPLFNEFMHTDFTEAHVNIIKGSLMTDMIHFVDYLFHDVDHKNIKPYGEILLDTPIASKRHGHIEHTGKLSFIDTKTNRKLHFTSSKNITEKSVTLINEKSKSKIIVNQGQENSFIYSDDLLIKSKSERMLLQSEMTGEIIFNHIFEDSCPLIDLSRAIDLHKAIYFPLLEEYQNIYKIKGIFPFT